MAILLYGRRKLLIYRQSVHCGLLDDKKQTIVIQLQLLSRTCMPPNYWLASRDKLLWDWTWVDCRLHRQLPCAGSWEVCVCLCVIIAPAIMWIRNRQNLPFNCSLKNDVKGKQILLPFKKDWSMQTGSALDLKTMASKLYFLPMLSFQNILLSLQNILLSLHNILFTWLPLDGVHWPPCPPCQLVI